MRADAIKSKRGRAIASKIIGIRSKVADPIYGINNAISDARSSMTSLKAQADSTQDFVSKTNCANASAQKRKEIAALKQQLNDLLDEAMPNAGDLMDELIAARDEDARANADELVKHLKIVSNLLAEQYDRDQEYSQLASIMRTDLASTRIKEDLYSKTRLTHMDTALHDNKYSRSQSIIGNMISTFLNEC